MNSKDYLRTALLSYSGPVIILDIQHCRAFWQKLEDETGFTIDEHEVYDNVFRAMDDEAMAPINVDEILLYMASKLFPYDELVFGGSTSDTIKRVIGDCRRLSQQLLEQVRQLGLYREGRLQYVFHSCLSHDSALFLERSHDVCTA